MLRETGTQAATSPDGLGTEGPEHCLVSFSTMSPGLGRWSSLPRPLAGTAQGPVLDQRATRQQPVWDCSDRGKRSRGHLDTRKSRDHEDKRLDALGRRAISLRLFARSKNTKGREKIGQPLVIFGDCSLAGQRRQSTVKLPKMPCQHSVPRGVALNMAQPTTRSSKPTPGEQVQPCLHRHLSCLPSQLPQFPCRQDVM